MSNLAVGSNRKLALDRLQVISGKLLPPRRIASGPQEVATLEPNKAIDRDLSGGQKHRFQIVLASGQYVKVIVEQRGIDVFVRLLGSDGKSVTDFDSELTTHGEEVVEFTTKDAGTQILSIEAKQKNAATAQYEIRIVEVRNATDRDNKLDEARKLNTEANRLWREDKYDEALPVAQRALEIRERELGPDAADVATSLFVLANQYNDKGQYAKAETLYLRALEIREKALGKDHLLVSLILNNLGNLYRSKGEYVKAEALFTRALAIREKNLDPNNLLIAGELNNLATISNQKGDTATAVELYKRSLEIREKALGPDHPEVATSLNNLANLYSDPAKAEPLYRRALAIREKVLGPDDPDVGQTLYNLAVLRYDVGDFKEAQQLGERALAILQKSLGADHPFTSYPLNLLAELYKNSGSYAKSEEFYQRSISVKEKSQGPNHPDLGGALSNLANLYAVIGQPEKAISTQSRANSIIEYNIGLNLMTGSEREKLAYLDSLSDIEDQTIMLNLQTAPNSPAAANLAAEIILQRKGRVLDAMADSLAVLRRRFNAQDQSLLDKLNEVSAKLAGLVLDGPRDASVEDHERAIKTLETERESMEREISLRSAGFYQETKPVTVQIVQDAIPAGAVLVEFAVYHATPLKAYDFVTDRASDPSAAGEVRYAAYILHGRGEVTGQDLGPAKTVDEALAAFRNALRDPQSKEVQRLGRNVDRLIMEPIRGLLKDSTQLLISPDGGLNLIPFEALVDEKGQYLIERYSVTYLTSGRDLLRMKVTRESKSTPLVIADPTFGEPSKDNIKVRAAKASTPANSTEASARTTTAQDIADVYFAPLGGTALEARAIQGLFPDARILTGERATESALKQAAAPSILHIATHGFFLEDKKPPTGDTSRVSMRGIKSSARIEDPLLRSGLALADANLHNGTSDDGILTALDAAGLNLWGTKLVVLSACDTGVGEVRVGEGVYGLRRAFVLAGAESLVMSLWPVSDYATRELMTNYYKDLKQGIGRGAALRQVKLEMLKRNRQMHPFYWANFIQSGDWTPLNRTP